MDIELSLIDLRSQEDSAVITTKAYGEQLEALISSIKKIGIINPPTVRKNKETGRYTVIFGNRRIIALKRIGVTVVKCIVV